MTKYGIEASQEGISLGSAADYQLALSSNWPTLQVLASGEVSGVLSGQSFYCTDQYFAFGTSGAETIVYQHKKGYMCPFYLVQKDPTTGVADTDGTLSGDTFHWYLFDQDITATVEKQTKGATPSSPGNSKYGIEALNTNANTHDISSKDYRNFSLNTKARPLQIHMSGKGTIDANLKVVVQHDLGYPPTYFFYYGHFLAAAGDSNHAIEVGASVTQANSSTITFRGVQAPFADPVYYIILKDPISII